MYAGYENPPEEAARGALTARGRWLGLACAAIASCEPRGEGGIFDAALPGKRGRAEAAGLEGVEHLSLVLSGVTGASDAVGLDDGAGVWIDEH